MDYGPAANGDQADQFRMLVEAMSEWEKERFFRFMMRVHNHDEEALRLADLVAAGTISRRQMLERL